MVTVVLTPGLVMATVTVLLSNMVLITVVMIMTVVTVPMKNVPVAELKSLLNSRKVMS
jgi:hypothetical protein